MTLHLFKHTEIGWHGLRVLAVVIQASPRWIAHERHNATQSGVASEGPGSAAISVAGRGSWSLAQGRGRSRCGLGCCTRRHYLKRNRGFGLIVGSRSNDNGFCRSHEVGTGVVNTSAITAIGKGGG